MYLDLVLRIFVIDALFNSFFSPFIAVRDGPPVRFIHRIGIHDMRDNPPVVTRTQQLLMISTFLGVAVS